MPCRVRLRTTLAQVRCDHRPKVVHPAPDCLVRDGDAAFRRQIFDVAKAQREPEIEPDRLVNDLGREPIPAVADFLHSIGYRAARRTASLKRVTIPADLLASIEEEAARLTRFVANLLDMSRIEADAP